MPNLDNGLKAFYLDGKAVRKASLDGKVFFQKHDYNLSLTADKSVFQVGDTSTLTATLTDYNEPIEGETVLMYDSDNVSLATYYNWLDVFLFTVTSENQGEIIFDTTNAEHNNFYTEDEKSGGGYSNGGRVKFVITDTQVETWRYNSSTDTWTKSMMLYNLPVKIGFSYGTEIISNTAKIPFFAMGITDSSGECSVGYVGKYTGTINIKSEVPSLSLETELNDIPIVYNILLNGNKNIIQTGEQVTLTAKLPAMDGVTIDNQTILLSKNIADSNLEIDLTATSNIIQVGDICTLTATVTDENNIGVENIIINFYKDGDNLAKELVATLVTDSSGEATYDYVGEGVGGIEFSAESGILQSETYSLWDTLFAIDGTSDTGNWEINSLGGGVTATATYSNEGTHFVATGTGASYISLYKGNVHPFDGTNDLIFEFDYKSANISGLYLVNNGGARVFIHNVSPSTNWIHDKWVYDATNKVLTAYINDVAQTPVDLSAQNLITLGFQITDWQTDIDFWIKNFKVYNG